MRQIGLKVAVKFLGAWPMKPVPAATPPLPKVPLRFWSPVGGDGGEAGGDALGAQPLHMAVFQGEVGAACVEALSLVAVAAAVQAVSPGGLPHRAGDPVGVGAAVVNEARPAVVAVPRPGIALVRVADVGGDALALVEEDGAGGGRSRRRAYRRAADRPGCH